MPTASEENKIPQRGKSRKTSRAVKVFFLLWGLLIFSRVCYDILVCCQGGTIAFRMTGTYDYLVRVPPGYTGFSAPRPILVFLHGAGEIGHDVKQVAGVDPFHYAAGKLPRKDFPFIVLSPVVPQGYYDWNPKAVKIMIDHFLRHCGRLKIDPGRIYLTGFSMGGFGTFAVAGEYPDLFAAIAPLAGGGETNRAERLQSIPVRAFHGDDDEVVSYDYSVKMIEAVKAAGNGDARLTIIPKGKHQICPDVYGNPDIYRWFLDHGK